MSIPWRRIRKRNRIVFPTTDGLTLRGSLYRHDERFARGLILFCSEFGANHWSALSYCEGLWEAGFNIFAFDFRNQGESDTMSDYEPVHWLTDYEVNDVLAALQYIQSHEELSLLPVGLFGISRGGSAALAAAALSSHVVSVACEGAFTAEDVVWQHGRRWLTLYVAPWLLAWIPEWHIRLSFQLGRLVSQSRRRCRYTKLDRLLTRLRNKPILLITGGQDKYVFPEIAQSLCRKTGHGPECLWNVPDAGHNMSRQAAPKVYDSQLIEFFFDSLVAPQIVGSPKPEPVAP